MLVRQNKNWDARHTFELQNLEQHFAGFLKASGICTVDNEDETCHSSSMNPGQLDEIETMSSEKRARLPPLYADTFRYTCFSMRLGFASFLEVYHLRLDSSQ